MRWAAGGAYWWALFFVAAGWLPPVFGRPHLRAICPPLASYLLSGAFRSVSYLLATCFSLARHLLSACLEGKAHRPQTRPGGRPLPAAYPPHRRPCISSTTLHLCNAHRMRHALAAHASAQRHASRTTSPKRHQKRGRPPRAVAASSSSAASFPLDTAALDATGFFLGTTRGARYR